MLEAIPVLLRILGIFAAAVILIELFSRLFNYILTNKELERTKENVNYWREKAIELEKELPPETFDVEIKYTENGKEKERYLKNVYRISEGHKSTENMWHYNKEDNYKTFTTTEKEIVFNKYDIINFEIIKQEGLNVK